MTRRKEIVMLLLSWVICSLVFTAKAQTVDKDVMTDFLCKELVKGMQMDSVTADKFIPLYRRNRAELNIRKRLSRQRLMRMVEKKQWTIIRLVRYCSLSKIFRINIIKSFLSFFLTVIFLGSGIWNIRKKWNIFSVIQIKYGHVILKESSKNHLEDSFVKVQI